MSENNYTIEEIAAKINDPKEVDSFLARLPQGKMIDPGYSCGCFLHYMAQHLGLPSARVGTDVIYYNVTDEIKLKPWLTRWQDAMMSLPERTVDVWDIPVSTARNVLSDIVGTPR